MKGLPLKGLVVLEFSQYLSGPLAGLRLADLGARVIKIERPTIGEAGRKLAIKDLWVGDNSLLFHTINRNKESFTADLKNAEDLSLVKQLITKADILIHNFRPEVMGKIGLDFTTVQQLNPQLVYAELSGYGKVGPWKDKPGQDLLLQAISGITYTTGNGNNNPVPFGISIADIFAGSQLVQIILAALIRRQKTGNGALVEVSMLESLLDFQFELLTTYYASEQQPKRSEVANGQPLLSAPYGIYVTQDGHIAISMMNIHLLATTIGCADLLQFELSDAFTHRDEIKNRLAAFLSLQKTDHWLSLLQAAGLWSMQVLNWEEMTKEVAYQTLQMEQIINTGEREITTTRCPIRFDGERLFSEKPAPLLGQHNEQILKELRNDLTA